ncbi:MAG: PVC-type heme-binding CxxCH protein [Prosthecobacter sp.]|uniref:PVC-type heme-binding CxxCH protein n=1 Tax=Prosthecobacter sp. TaxID=1965333 RepID=UPI0039043905
MKRLLLCLAVISAFSFQLSAFSASPLRVFIRAGKKSHGPGAHDFPQFLKEWVPMLNERGAKADGGMEFPTKEQLDKTDVLILHAQEAGNINIGPDRKNLMEFIARGGGVVTIHAGAVSRDHEWFKSIIGGSWNFEHTKWLEGPMHLYFTDKENPITKDMSNFAMDDEIYYDMDLLPECKILAGAYTPKPAGLRNEKAAKKAEESTKGGKQVSIYDIQPQIWSYEKDAYRAFTCIPGHYHKNFSHPTMRALLLRGIAWAGKRENADELCRPDELGDSLRYVEGGPTRPEKAAEKLEVHPEFDISLVAAEPLINKVMNVDWDEKGRLWVCETPEYPNGRRELNVEKWKDSGSWTKTYDRDPTDRISILTDTNGDGIMDKKHVFADKLELVTSFCFYKNGVIACAAPDIWFLEDTNGDEVADKRTKLYTGLGTGDTHAVINNLRWGLDGWVYATHGYSAGDVECLGKKPGSAQFSVLSAQSKDSKPAANTEHLALSTEHSAPVRIGSGVIRFKPDGTEIEQYASKGGNTWGLDITSDGQVFFTQPTSGTVLYHAVLPEYVLAKGKIPGTNSYKGMITGQKTFPLMSWPEQAYVQIDFVGSFTAAAGCAIYEGGAWPEKWNYSYFTTEPTLNIVHHQFVEKDGVSYKTHKEAGREETEFIRSKDLWFRPIENRVGPDGALYVVDFYNQAVIHNDTRGPIHGPANAAVRPDRDHYFGRIWKVQHKQAKPVAGSFYHHGSDSKGTMGSAALKIYESKGDSLSTFKSAQDDWTRSAVIAAAADHAEETIAQALASPEGVETLVRSLLPSMKSAENLIKTAANADAKASALKVILLQGIAQQVNEAPALTPALTEAFKKLLADPSTAGAALPLVTKWDKAGALAGEVKAQLASLGAKLSDDKAPIEARISAAQALIGVGGEFGVPALAGTDAPKALQSAIITALDEKGAARDLVGIFIRLKAGLQAELRTQAFDAILKRPESSLAMLTAIADGKIDPKDIGPGNIARLRTHPNKQVAKQANAMMDKLNPGAKAKNEIIAKLTPEVEKPGNLANGKAMFTATCAVCHKLGDIGKDVAPPLVGMGAHGPAELLVHIVDPNREVDPSFWAWNVTKKNGDVHVGVITSENQASVNLRNQGGDVEIKKSDIATRENTRRSLMPEGLDALGPEVLRDILSFICGSGDQKFRVIDLRTAYNADSRVGIFRGEEFKDETVTLHKFGNVTVHGVPFFIMDPEKSQTGASFIALKGGGKGTVANNFPAKVEITTNATAASLHLLGGVGGWAWPFGGDGKIGEPAMTVHVDYADGDQEAIVLKNGEHFADYIGRAEVPLSEDTGDFTRRGQLRYLAINLKKKAQLKKLTLETSGGMLTPCTVAITASSVGVSPATSAPGILPGSGKAGRMPAAPASGGTPDLQPKSGGPGDGPLVPATPVNWEAGKTKVLVIGGGSSHNFAEFFGKTDVTTLKAAGFTVHYTEDRDQAATELANADVAIISVNRKFFDTAVYRKALFDFAAAGKGIVMLHPGTWYGFGQWPELNAQIVGGGARGHDKIHPFEVKAVKADHPIMQGVPPSFTVEDELYYVNAEPDKTPPGTAKITVLAETSPSDKFKASHPSVWITEHPKAKIVGIALGHDARVHDLKPYQQLLINASKWSSGK